MLDEADETGGETIPLPEGPSDQTTPAPVPLDNVMSGEDITRISGNMETAFDKLEQEPGIDRGLLEIAREQAVSFIRKLEENYFFRTHYNNNPDAFVGEKAKTEIENILSREAQPILRKALEEIRDEIIQAIDLQTRLHARGLNLKTNLNLYQLVGVYRMLERKKIILADEMGLGKTLQSISTFLLSEAQEMLVFSPKLALNRWMDDIAKHVDTPLEIVLLADEPVHPALLANEKISIVTFKTSKERFEYLLSGRAPPEGRRRIILMNYDLLPGLNTYRKEKKITSIKVDFLAMDEAHLLKRGKNATTQAIFGKPQNCGGGGCEAEPKDEGEGEDADTYEGIETVYEQIITGTPLENGPGDLLNFMKRLAKGGTSEAEKMFQGMDPKRFSILFRKTDVGKLSALFGFLSERMVRRLKHDVMTGLPVKKIVNVKLNPIMGTMAIEGQELELLPGEYMDQLKLYETVLQNYPEFAAAYEARILAAVQAEAREGQEKAEAEKVDDEEAVVDDEVNTISHRGTQILRMEQVVGEPLIFEDGMDNIKFDALVKMIKSRLEAKKSVGIFSRFSTITRRLRQRLIQEGYEDILAYVDGTVTGTERQDQISSIQNNEAKIIIATQGTMWLAVELTQLESLFILDRAWKPSTESQLVDRAHRFDPIRNYPGKELEIIYLDFDVRVSIDDIKRRYSHRKDILSKMVINGNLAPEILAAFRDNEASVADEIEEATASPASFDEYEQTLAQKFRLLVGKITATSDSDKRRQLFDELAELYYAILEHKGSLFANMASLDHLASDAYPELKGSEPKKVLDLASGPSTLYRAYQRKWTEFRSKGFNLDITDYDSSREMLRRGVNRGDGQQIVGTFEALSQMPADSYDLINLSFAYRYVTHPKEFFANIHKMLKDKGFFSMILPPNSGDIPPRFFEALKAMGFELRVGEGAELESKLDGETYQEFARMYGAEFADDMAKQVRGRFTYLVAVKSDQPPAGADGFEDGDFRLKRPMPEVNEGKIEAIKRSQGEVKLVPDTALVRGSVTIDDTKQGEREAVAKTEKSYKAILRRFLKIKNFISNLADLPETREYERRRAKINGDIRGNFEDLAADIDEYFEENLTLSGDRMLAEMNFTAFRNEGFVQKWLKKDGNAALLETLETKVKAIAAARSELRTPNPPAGGETRNEWVNWEEAVPLIRNYGAAVLNGEVSKIKIAGDAFSLISGFDAPVSENGVVRLPQINKKRAIIQSIPEGVKSVRIEVLNNGGDEIYFKININADDVRYFKFTAEKSSYLTPRDAPGIEEIGNYAAAFLSPEGPGKAELIAAAREKILRVLGKGMDFPVTSGGTISFPMINKRNAFLQNLPEKIKSVRVTAMPEEDGAFLKIEAAEDDVRYFGFSTKLNKRYLASRNEAGIHEIEEYAEVFLSPEGPERTEKLISAGKKLLRALKEGILQPVREARTFGFPMVQKKNSTVQDIPEEVDEIRIRAIEQEGEIFFKIEINEKDVRYYKFVRNMKSVYLVVAEPRAIPEIEKTAALSGILLIAEYAEAFLSADSPGREEALHKAVEELKKVQKDGIPAKANPGGTLSFPTLSQGITAVIDLPASADVIIFPVIEEREEGTEVFLKITAGPDDVRYFAFSKTSKMYLKTRFAPLFQEIVDYMQAYRGENDLTRPTARLAFFQKDGVTVKADAGGIVSFSRMDGLQARVEGLPAGAEGTIKPVIRPDLDVVYILIKFKGARTRYFSFSKEGTSYLVSLRTSSEEDAVRKLVENSEDPKKISKWILAQYKKAGPFEVEIDVTALVEPGDLEQGIIPSNFVFSDGKLAGSIEAGKRKIEGAEKAKGIIAFLIKDADGNISYAFEARSELRHSGDGVVSEARGERFGSWQEFRNLFRIYTKAFFSGEEAKKTAAAKDLMAVRVFEAAVEDSGTLNLPSFNGKQGSLRNLPPKAKVRIETKAEGGDVYLEVRVSENDTRYYRLAKEERKYLVAGYARGMHELKNYAEAYLSENPEKTAKAKEELLKIGSFEIAAGESGELSFPKFGNKKASLSKLPAKARVLVEVKEDGDEVYLKLTLPGNNLKHLKFTREAKGYLAFREMPGLHELQNYADAYLGEDPEKTAKARAAFLKTGSFEVSASVTGIFNFPPAGNKLAGINRFPPKGKLLIEVKEEGGDLYLKISSGKIVKYYGFSKKIKETYLQFLKAKNESDVPRLLTELSQDPERIKKWLLEQYQKAGPFEVEMNITALAEKSDLENGLIPSNFPYSDGKLGAAIPAEERKLQGVNDAQSIILFLKKDAAGNITYVFEGRYSSQEAPSEAEQEGFSRDFEKITDYAAAYDAGADLTEAIAALQKLADQGGISFQVSEKGVLTFPAAGTRVFSFSKLPPSARGKIVPVINKKAKGVREKRVYLALSGLRKGMLILDFTKKGEKYLTARKVKVRPRKTSRNPGLQAILDYALALRGEEDLEAATDALEKFSEKGIQAKAPEGGVFNFPTSADTASGIRIKYGLALSPKQEFTIYPVIEEVGGVKKVSLKVVVTPEDVRYFDFTLTGKSYLEFRPKVSKLKEIADYAAAFRSGKGIEEAVQSLEKLQKEGVRIEIPSSGDLLLPDILGGKFRASISFPNIKEVVIFPVLEKRGKKKTVYLRIEAGPKDVRYFEFSKDRATYLILRPAPGFKEILDYAAAYRQNTDLVEPLAGLVKFQEGGIPAQTTANGTLYFSSAGELRFNISDLAPNTPAVIWPIFDNEYGVLYVRVEMGGRAVKYLAFSKTSGSYFNILKVKNDADAVRQMVGRSGDPEKIKKWILSQYKKTGPFEVEMNVTALAAPEDLTQGIIPSNFVFSDGKLAGSIEAGKRKIEGAEKAKGIIAFLIKDAAGNISYAFEPILEEAEEPEIEDADESIQRSELRSAENSDVYSDYQDFAPGQTMVISTLDKPSIFIEVLAVSLESLEKMKNAEDMMELLEEEDVEGQVWNLDVEDGKMKIAHHNLPHLTPAGTRGSGKLGLNQTDKFDDLEITMEAEGVKIRNAGKRTLYVKAYSRSEVRLTRKLEESRARFENFFEGPRQRILPYGFQVKFEARNIQRLIEMLSGLLGQTVYAEESGVSALTAREILSESLGDGNVRFSDAAKTWFGRQTEGAGYVLLDSAWLEEWTEKSPRTLYLMLSALRETDVSKGPRVLISGEQDLYGKIRDALQKNQKSYGVNGLSWEEKMEAESFLGRAELEKLVRVIPEAELGAAIKKYDHAVIALTAGRRVHEGLAPRFFLDPAMANVKDWPAAVFLIFDLIKASQVVKGEANVSVQAALLREKIKDLVPGAENNGNDFVISWEKFVLIEVVARRMLEASA